MGCKSAPAPAAAIAGETGEWRLVWSDEFTGSKLDAAKWSYQNGTGAEYGLDGWGNNEQEYYDSDNVTIADGSLYLEAKREAKGGKPFTSGRIRTLGADGKPLFTTTFGRVEARISLPTGSGVWPAFWMLPATKDYGVWAASGEIDIMEAKGRLANRVYGTLHYGQAWPGNKYAGGMYKFPDETDCTEFHDYAIEWEPSAIRWYVDGNKYYETSSWWAMAEGADAPYKYPAPFDVPFYIVLNLAIGGNYDDGRVPDEGDLPAVMEVDYVRVYEKVGGYDRDVKRPEPPRDKEAFAAFATDASGSFIADRPFATINGEAMSTNGMNVNSRDWYFLALAEFGGKATAKTERVGDADFRRVTIVAPGTEVHSVQLIQHLPIAKGYTYEISFDAKASTARTIAVKLGGDGDNSWAVYSSQYAPALTSDVKRFKYKFTMEAATDKTARLEFNLGKGSGDVWIGNVEVRTAEF